MTQIVLTPEQIEQLSTADEEVVFVDANGCRLAYVATGFTPGEIAAAEQRTRSGGPWHSTEAVLASLE